MNNALDIALQLAVARSSSRPSLRAASRLSDWIPQCEQADDAAAVLSNFLKMTSARTALDASLFVRETRGAPPSLEAIRAWLAKAGVDAKINQLSSAQLAGASYPAISFLRNGQCVLLVGTLEDNVYLLDPGLGWKVHALGEFGRVWSGAILAVANLNEFSRTSSSHSSGVSQESEEWASVPDEGSGRYAIIDKFLSPLDCETMISVSSRVTGCRCDSGASVRGRLPSAHPLVADLCARASARLGMRVLPRRAPAVFAHRPQLSPQSGESSVVVSEFGDPPSATFLVYLNEDVVGGDMYFPILGEKVAPIAGRALHWRNRLAGGGRVNTPPAARLPVYAGTQYMIALELWDR